MLQNCSTLRCDLFIHYINHVCDQSAAAAMPKLQKTTQLWVLVVVVLLDLLAVSLVVPLLPARYRELGVGAKALGFASSAYSLAQIVGGLALGALSDRSLGHRGLLLLSFVGAATA